METREKIEQLRVMAEQDPDDALTFFLLGSELLHAEQYPGAAEALTRCLVLNPRHTAAARLLGDAWRKAGETDRARQAYEAAIALAEATGDLQVAREARALLKKTD